MATKDSTLSLASQSLALASDKHVKNTSHGLKKAHHKALLENAAHAGQPNSAEIGRHSAVVDYMGPTLAELHSLQLWVRGATFEQIREMLETTVQSQAFSTSACHGNAEERTCRVMLESFVVASATSQECGGVCHPRNARDSIYTPLCMYRYIHEGLDLYMFRKLAPHSDRSLGG